MDCGNNPRACVEAKVFYGFPLTTKQGILGFYRLKFSLARNTSAQNLWFETLDCPSRVPCKNLQDSSVERRICWRHGAWKVSHVCCAIYPELAIAAHRTKAHSVPDKMLPIDFRVRTKLIEACIR
eukprot:1188730-Prorocentrum_minimum.AAC.4